MNHNLNLDDEEDFQAYLDSEADVPSWDYHPEEYDPEAWIDLELHNMLHPEGYCS